MLQHKPEEVQVGRGSLRVSQQGNQGLLEASQASVSYITAVSAALGQLRFTVKGRELLQQLCRFLTYQG